MPSAALIARSASNAQAAPSTPNPAQKISAGLTNRAARLPETVTATDRGTSPAPRSIAPAVMLTAARGTE